MVMLIKSQTHKLRNQLNSWRMLIIKDFNIDHLICPKCKVEFETPLEMVLEFEQEYAFNGLPISTLPYTICPKCQHNKYVPLDYKSKRGYHNKYEK